MKEQKFKSCPFCGGEANLITDVERLGCCNTTEKRYAMLTCLNCGVRTPRILEDVEYCAVDKVKEIWEKRVGDDNVL